ncbi:MAG TPA: flavin reductase [Bacteroidales bacterium]|nr:flavin reductase [Bacteroidales bacterium]
MKALLSIIIIITTVFFSCTAQTNLEDMKEFKKIGWEGLNNNAIELIGKDWMLISAGNIDDYNMMTAAWGSLGWLWEIPVTTIFVRPQRHTHIYTEREDYYTICFFNKDYREVLVEMGSVSGRNFDKMGYEKLRPVITPNESIAFKEASIIIECKKIYTTVLKEGEFIDHTIVDDKYPQKDFHTMYVGEITGVWVRE